MTLASAHPHRLPAPLRALALLVVALVAMVPTAPFGAGSVAGAQGSANSVEQREALEDDLEAATAEELRLAGELAAASAERDRLALLLADVERRSQEAILAHRAAEDALGRATVELSAARARLRATERDLAAALDELRDQAVDSFIVGGHDEPLGVLMNAEDLREMGAAATYRAVVLEHQDLIVERVELLKVKRENRAEAAEVAKGVAADAVTEAEIRRQAVDAERTELRVLQTANAAAVATHATLLAEVQHRKAGYETELAALIQVSESLAAALATRQLGQVANPALQGTFVLPVPTARMSSSFGPRIHPIFGTARLHAGMDLAAPTGTPVGAAGFGTVVTSGVLGGYGNAVVIDHGSGLSTLYAHLSALHVAVGDEVEAGQTIGLVGSTGNSTGPHLHLEVRVFGTPVDPVNYL
ncbi:MAG: peptidoglycan DD-metalloendopeptidase family protein [Acidimicrobiales bacterium]